jgi:peptidoglycan hydrolase-like protein with peptidoglycan-binding domain
MTVYEDIDEVGEIDEPVDRARSHRAAPPRPHTTPILVGALFAVCAGVFAIDALRGSNPGGSASGDVAAAGDTVESVAPRALANDAAAGAPTVTQPAVAVPAFDQPAVDEPAVDEPGIDVEGCMLDVTSVAQGDSGPNVECVQKALTAAGFYSGAVDGVFSPALATAATQFQTATGLYVDGVVGRRTATMLGIWPGDDSFVVRTPPPPPGAEDSMGFKLSSVASTGAEAPPLPPNAGQGTGKRIVYQRAGQRVWAIDDDENIVRSYLVTGSQYNNELPGVHKVYSKSEMTTGWNGEADLPLMVRWLDTERGAIGFHQIPIHKSDGTVYQTEAELGQRMSGGCQRQAPLDANFMWYFAEIGTPVHVL